MNPFRAPLNRLMSCDGSLIFDGPFHVTLLFKHIGGMGKSFRGLCLLCVVATVFSGP
jgi:hypothetical protein